MLIGYFAYVTALVTQALHGGADLEAAPGDATRRALRRPAGRGGATGLLPGHRGAARAVPAAVRLVPGRGAPRAAVGRDGLRRRAGAGADRAGQLGRPRDRLPGRGDVGLGAGPAGAQRRPHRSGHRGQALPALPAGRAARRGPAAPAAACVREGGRARPWRRGRWSTCRRCCRTSTAGGGSGASTPTGARTSGRCGWWPRNAGASFTPGTINRVSVVVFGARLPRRCWCSACAAPHVPRVPQLALLILLGFLVVNKVYSPQYVLWLLPLAVLARPRWRDLLVWQAGEVFYFVMVWMYLGGFTASATSGAHGRGLQLGDRGPGGGRALPRRGRRARHPPAVARPGAALRGGPGRRPDVAEPSLK